MPRSLSNFSRLGGNFLTELDSDHKHEVSRGGAYRHFRNFLLGNAREETARLAELTPLGWWGNAEIAGLKLAGGAIRIEIQDTFARQRAIAGAILPNLLACCEHHGVELFLD